MGVLKCSTNIRIKLVLVSKKLDFVLLKINLKMEMVSYPELME